MARGGAIDMEVAPLPPEALPLSLEGISVELRLGRSAAWGTKVDRATLAPIVKNLPLSALPLSGPVLYGFKEG